MRLTFSGLLTQRARSVMHVMKDLETKNPDHAALILSQGLDINDIRQKQLRSEFHR